jgi:hypothetical protein
MIGCELGFEFCDSGFEAMLWGRQQLPFGERLDFAWDSTNQGPAPWPFRLSTPPAGFEYRRPK